MSLSEDERELLRTPDSVLRERAAATVSFDMDRMVDRVNGGEWQNVLQAHLYLDHVLTLILRENVPNPNALKLDRIGFSQKVDLANALSLVPASHVALLRRVNTLRNKISHDVDYVLTDIDTRAVCNTVPTHLAQHIKADPYPEPGLTFRKVLVFTILTLDVMRQGLATNNALGRKLSVRLHAVAQKIPFDFVE